MSKAGSAAKVKLSSYDDLFGNAEEEDGERRVDYQGQAHWSLHEFRNHPFRMARDDEKMEETTESISKYKGARCRGTRPREEWWLWKSQPDTAENEVQNGQEEKKDSPLTVIVPQLHRR